jgi:hypothetical protein
MYLIVGNRVPIHGKDNRVVVMMIPLHGFAYSSRIAVIFSSLTSASLLVTTALDKLP